MSAKKLPTLAIIVPCYYEEDILPSTILTLTSVIDDAIQRNTISSNSYICFVNDGSADGTWSIINENSKGNPHVKGIDLSRNFGHQAALLAGLFNSIADIYISIDADLQDDELKIHDMISAYSSGYEIVYGVRNDRETDTFFKRSTAALFYDLRAKLGCETIRNHADYRLMSHRAVQALKEFTEVNLFLRGVIPMLGFSSTKVYYARKERTLGESKYPLFKMLKFAWQGIVNFSELPLHLILWIGLVGIAGSICASVYSILQWSYGHVVLGWTSLFLIICFFGSLNFLFMGIIGLYLGKIFKETKQRPRFIIQRNTMDKIEG